MHKVIYKYPLEVIDTQSISLPVGATILAIKTQRNMPFLWAIVDPSTIEKDSVVIEIFGTGHPISHDIGVSRKHIDTFMLNGGDLVFHAFQYTGV